MDKKFQVFVSSTYKDLKDERQAVVSAILEAGHIPAGMELFASGDKSQLETIKRWIEDSDVFMLILGGRYGSVESDSGKSYIELEYDLANACGKPYFAAVMQDDYFGEKVKKDGVEVVETEHNADHKRFKTVVTSKICKFFSNLDQLKLIVHQSLLAIERDRKVMGWVRADNVPDAKAVLDQIAKLNEENSALREKLSQAKAELPPEERYNGYEFRELFDLLNKAAIQPYRELTTEYGLRPSDTVLSVFWEFRKRLSLGLTAYYTLVGTPMANRADIWLVDVFMADLTIYGLVDTVKGDTSTMAKLSPSGLQFIGRIDRDEKMKRLIAPLRLSQTQT
jgi:hypothetical protein